MVHVSLEVEVHLRQEDGKSIFMMQRIIFGYTAIYNFNEQIRNEYYGSKF